MKPLFHPSLVNGPFDDPALYIDFLFDRRAILFDLGDLHALPSRKILRISHVFVSHTHMDHFTGFDRILRIMLARDKRMSMFGPPGFLHRVENRLASYTWNLVEGYSTDFTIIAAEFDGGRIRSACFRCRGRFRREKETTVETTDGILLDEDTFRVRCALLDHGAPCLAFTLEEKNHVNIMKNHLLEMGFQVGPWLTELKTAALRGAPDEESFRVWWREGKETRETEFTVGKLRKKILRIVPGQKITYVTDILFSAENAVRTVALARNADYLFIEAMFLHEDAHLAEKKHHLTTRHAALIGLEAGANRIIPFHFSPRYTGQEDLLRQEVEEVFRNRPTF